MNYWDDEFCAGRFEEFKTFVDALDLTKLSPEVILGIHMAAQWIKDKYDFSEFGRRVREQLKNNGFPPERIAYALVGLP